MKDAQNGKSRKLPDRESLRLRSGELVEVRRIDEILKTLDANGRLDEMPFMPEMLQYCGKRFRVGKRAHKTCDPVNGLHGRRMERMVHLEDLRCDGAAHDDCQAGCLLFWKEAWLRRVDASLDVKLEDLSGRGRPDAICTERTLFERTVASSESASEGDQTYICQATKVADASHHLAWWDLRQYVEDIASRNIGLRELGAAITSHIARQIAEAGIGVGSLVRWLYDSVQTFRGGAVYPARVGEVPKGARTPTLTLDLKPGETVRMKSYSQILKTLDETSRNRGLYFDSEMVPYCNGTYRVKKRVERIIDEKSGRMLRFKTDVILLEGVVCQARYAKFRKFCPRGYYQYAREIWLERITDGAHGHANSPGYPSPRTGGSTEVGA